MINLRRIIFWSIIGIGISSITVQLVVVRELLTQFQGNEITISVAVFSWLLLTGMGSYSARFVKSSSVTLYSVLAFFAALLPLPQLAMIRHFREEVFIHGVSPGFYHIFFFILAATAIYCLLSGFILPWSLEVLKHNGHDSTSGDIYIIDNIGDISGGIIFSFILVYWATPFQAIALTSAPAIMSALTLMFIRGKKYLMAVAMILTAGFYMIALNSNFEISSISGQYGEIVKYLESPYGRIVITGEGTQRTFWESGLPLYSDENVMESEEEIHYPLSQLKSVGDVLVISGGLGETLNEVIKYNPGHVDYVELDPYLTGVAEEMGLLKKKPFIDIINTDARSFIKKAGKKYDAIIINLPDPDTFQINRFFTSEFFGLAKEALNRDGVLSFGLEYSENYLSRTNKKKLSSMFNTASSRFKNVEIIPGAKAYFICSDGDLSLDIPGLLEEKAISTTYIEGFYQGNVTEDRIKNIQAAIDQGEGINRDFNPRIINIIFDEWFSRYDTSPWLFIIILAVASIVYLFFIRSEEYILFSTGFAVMGAEMLIIFTFQIIYGYIYLRIGAIVTAFLIGLLPGAILGRAYQKKSIAVLMGSEVIILGLLFIFLAWNVFFKVEISQVYFFIYCFLFSFCCGFQFPVITGIIGERSQPIAGCLAADFTGAAIGTILVGAFLIPSLGIQTSIIFLILIKISSISTLLLSWGRKRSYN
jgi:spermidine synthase